MCSGLLIASNTRWRGASKTRVRRISHSDGVVTAKLSLFTALPTGMSLLLCFEFLQVRVQTIEALLPDGPISLRPLGHFLERRRVEPAGPPLGITSPDDQPCAFENTQVLRDGRHAHRERLRQFGDRALTRREAAENRTPGGVGERGERGAQLIDCH